MKQRAQYSLTDYYGLAKGQGHLGLICFIFVPFFILSLKEQTISNPSLSSCYLEPLLLYTPLPIHDISGLSLHIIKLSSPRDGMKIIYLSFDQTRRRF